MQKYQELVRPNAPGVRTTSNSSAASTAYPISRRCKKTIFDASYLVLGLGDVYLGAPVATPMDPRHRLVTTKYNPARTWTPENAVGIGGAYMCIYGMEGPGGYQLFGRTIQVWNTWRQTPAFAASKPWLLDFFDQIRFFPVSHDELMEARAAFPHGAYPVKIEETKLSYADYAADLARNAGSHRRLQAHPAGRLRSRTPALEGRRPRQLHRRRGRQSASDAAKSRPAISASPPPCRAISGRSWSRTAPMSKPASPSPSSNP